MTDKEAKILDRLDQDYKWVESKGFNVLGVFLQGSQNYNLDYEGSDIDTKCIVIPTIEDIILNKEPYSTTWVREDNSHVDVKDIRLMWQCFKKQNINFLEILFTRYWCLNWKYQEEWTLMWDMREAIARYNNYAGVNCIAGMVYEKEKAMCHPYPTLLDKIQHYGYDNKQLHHIIRCEEFLRRWVKGTPYADCLIPTDSEYLISVKSDYIYSLEEAKALAKELVERTKKVKEEYMLTHECVVNDTIGEYMNQVLAQIIKKSFIEELKNEYC